MPAPSLSFLVLTVAGWPACAINQPFEDPELLVMLQSSLEVADTSAAADAMPAEPGCWVRLSSGCPGQPTFQAPTWRKDSVASSKLACEDDRHKAFVAWCATSRVEMVFVSTGGTSGSLAPAAPADPGCYVWLPRGCPKQPSFTAPTWRVDAAGMASKAACDARRTAFESWCGSPNSRMLFVETKGASAVGPRIKLTSLPSPSLPGVQPELSLPASAPGGAATPGASTPAAADAAVPANASDATSEVSAADLPRRAGCYVNLQAGCPKHPEMLKGSAAGWRKDSWHKWRDYHEWAATSDQSARLKKICLEERLAQFKKTCETDQVSMFWVPATLKFPSVPGCFTWAPMGCPNQPWYDVPGWNMNPVIFLRPSVIGTRSRPKASFELPTVKRDACLVEERAKFREWCGAHDHHVDMLWHPAPPLEPGCWVFMPSGCRRFPNLWEDTGGYQKDTWSGWDSACLADTTSKTYCLQMRRAKIDEYCGNVDTKTHFVFGKGCKDKKSGDTSQPDTSGGMGGFNPYGGVMQQQGGQFGTQFMWGQQPTR